MTFAEIQNLLGLISDPVEKLEMVMDFGKNLEKVPDSAVCSEIVGCSSFVEICRDGNRFYGRADSSIVRGIVAIIVSMVDGKTALEIKNMDLLSEFQSLNLNLGAGRLNGLNSMIRFLQNL
mgnify:CR=1 FL=1